MRNRSDAAPPIGAGAFSPGRFVMIRFLRPHGNRSKPTGWSGRGGRLVSLARLLCRRDGGAHAVGCQYGAKRFSFEGLEADGPRHCREPWNECPIRLALSRQLSTSRKRDKVKSGVMLL
jgi:hypothetical protein